MMLVAEALRLPANARAADLAADIVASSVEWLALGTALHIAMRGFGGGRRFRNPSPSACFMSAWLPLIALTQMPVWGLRVSFTKEMADSGRQPRAGLERMARFVADLGAFGTARVLVSFVLATVLWMRLLASLYVALRTLNALPTGRALAAFTLGLATAVLFTALFYAPLLGAVYAAFGIPPGADTPRDCFGSFSRAPPRVSTQHFRRFPGLCRFWSRPAPA